MAGTSGSQVPTSTSAQAASATLVSTPSTQVGGGLPFTGTHAIPLLVAALALLALGASTLFSFRRRASQR
jgi:LPXTG-motif cell wall-anchored protein